MEPTYCDAYREQYLTTDKYLRNFINSNKSKSKQILLIDGYVRLIEKSLNNQIIPTAVALICFKLYYVSFYVITRTGLQAISIENMQRWKCHHVSEFNALSQCAIAQETIQFLENGTTLV